MTRPLLIGLGGLAAFAIGVVSLTVGGKTAGAMIPPAEGAAPSTPDTYAPLRAAWADGRAELSGYTLRRPRYGEQRTGTVVAIFVTEDLDDTQRVKTDGPRTTNTYPVMKLNLVEDFQTGVYDYNLMTSTFVRTAPRGSRAAGQPAKVSFTAQEWCGHAYQQLLFDEGSIRATSHSYFDGEGDKLGLLEWPEEGFSEDALLHWARGFAEPRLEPGKRKSVPWLPSLSSSRLSHQPLAWTRAELWRTGAHEEIDVPAGRFLTERYEARIDGGGSRRVWVEVAPPARVVRWEQEDGTLAELTGSERMPYWQLHSQKDVARRAVLGLPSAPPHEAAGR